MNSDPNSFFSCNRYIAKFHNGHMSFYKFDVFSGQTFFSGLICLYKIRLTQSLLPFFDMISLFRRYMDLLS